MNFWQDVFENQFWIHTDFIQISGALLIIILSFTLRNLFSAKILGYIQTVASKKSPRLHEQFLKTLTQPLSFVFVMAGIYLSVHLLRLPCEFQAILNTGLQVVGTFVFFWILYRLVDPFSFVFYSFSRAFDTELTEELKSFLTTILKGLVAVVGFLSILQICGINVAAFLAGLGLVGMAVAFAAQDTIKNLFGSLMIFLDKTFRKGDWIKTPDGEGTVETIGLRSTVLRQFDKAIIMIPNGRLMNSAVVNFSRMTQRRIHWTFGVTYDTNADQLSRIVSRIRRWLRENPDIETNPDKVTTLIHVDTFGESSINIFCYFFTKTTNWSEYMEIKEQSLMAFKRIVEEEGSAFAYPSRTLYLKEDQEEVKVSQYLKQKA